MRKFFIAVLLICCFPTFAWAQSGAAPRAASNPAPVTLTPDEARRALNALNDAKTRAKLSDTLRAITAAGALSAPCAGSARAAEPASAASGVLAVISENGLVSQVSREAATSLRSAASSVRRSAVALLDVHSVRTWWRDEIVSPSGRKQLRQLAGTLSAALLPAWLVGVLVGRLLRKRVAAVAASGSLRESVLAEKRSEAASEAVHEAEAAALGAGGAVSERGAQRAVRSQRNAAHASRHWSLLQRLPFALLHTLLKAIPLVVTVIIAVIAMSALTDEGSTDERVIETLIQIFAVARLVTLVCGLFFASDAPRLRLVPMSDEAAAVTQRWLTMLVSIVAIGIAFAEAPLPLGLTSDAHLGLVKLVTLIGHIMLALLFLQFRKPVGDWIRESTSHTRGLSLIGRWLAGAWAFIAVFVVIALWFVWALDVRDGYRVLLGRGGISLAILIGARLIAIVTFGVMGRVFRIANGPAGSIALQRAHRYYPAIRVLITVAIVLVAADWVLSIWNVHPWRAFAARGVGKRLISACLTVGIAAFAAIVVWEAINVSIERRLAKWTAAGDLTHAARLRTLVPMFRTMLFVGIALVVGLTILSELGVNIAPLVAGAGIFGVALGCGSQKLVQDFITGIFLLMENAMRVGDWVTVAGVSGSVEYLSIRTVRLRAGDGSLHTIPFSAVTTVNNSNRGLGNASVKVGIAYGQDIDLAVETLVEIGASLREDPRFQDGIVSDFSFWGVDQVDGAMLTLLGQIQCRDTARWPVQREFNRRIVERFRARGIEIANPLRTVVVSGNGAVPASVAAEQPSGDEAASGPSPR